MLKCGPQGCSLCAGVKFPMAMRAKCCNVQQTVVSTFAQRDEMMYLKVKTVVVSCEWLMAAVR